MKRCKGCETICQYGGPFKFVSSQSINEKSYINYVYGECKKWPCKCQVLYAVDRIVSYEYRFNCENWKSCQDNSWNKMLERIKK